MKRLLGRLHYALKFLRFLQMTFPTFRHPDSVRTPPSRPNHITLKTMDIWMGVDFGSNFPDPYDTAEYDQPQGDDMASYMRSIQSSLSSSPNLDLGKYLAALQLSMHATSLMEQAISTHNALQLD